jgi:spore coat protein U-like protein
LVSGVAPANGLVNATVYGRMPINLVQPVPYRDTVTVTVTF